MRAMHVWLAALMAGDYERARGVAAIKHINQEASNNE
jgi:hypothetical protein